MEEIKRFIKSCIPPLIISAIQLKRKVISSDNTWSGRYNSWHDVTSDCGGYDSLSILERCKQSLLKVKNSEAAYERDGVIFSKKQYSWALLSCLLHIALKKNNLSVLDFGGSLGSTYFQNRDFLTNVNTVNWSIVEQPSFVNCGKNFFQNDELNFHSSIEECAKVYSFDVVILSSVLQYLENPHTFLKRLFTYNIKYILIDRTSFIDENVSVLTVQNVPDTIYKASYPCWLFAEDQFLNLFLERYELVTDFASFADGDKIFEKSKRLYWKGFLFKAKFD